MSHRLDAVFVHGCEDRALPGRTLRTEMWRWRLRLRVGVRDGIRRQAIADRDVALEAQIEGWRTRWFR